MTKNIGNMIAASCSLGIAYAERLLKDVAATEFARFARPGGQVVTSNHPAFVLGHLSLYAPRIIGQLDGDTSATATPVQFQALFSKTATCQDDPDGSIYPAMDLIVDRYFAGYRTIQEALCNTPDTRFLDVNPEEGRLHELFPTIGAMHAFYVGGHMMTHLGQIGAWRRMMGMSAA